MPLSNPKPIIEYLLRTEKGKWFTSKDDDVQKVIFVSDKQRAQRFSEKSTADLWAVRVFDYYNGINLTVIEEKV